jgi:hypothetical protein
MCAPGNLGRFAQIFTENKRLNPCFLGESPKSRSQDRPRPSQNRSAQGAKWFMALALDFEESL